MKKILTYTPIESPNFKKFLRNSKSHNKLPNFFKVQIDKFVGKQEVRPNSTTSSKSTLKNYKESKIKSWKPKLQREFRKKSPINNLILRSSNKIPQPTTNSWVLSFLKVQPTKSPENKQPEKSTETDLFHSNKTHKKGAISREGNRIRREVPKILINHVISRNSSKYCNLQQSPSSWMLKSTNYPKTNRLNKKNQRNRPTVHHFDQSTGSRTRKEAIIESIKPKLQIKLH